ncbi:MAG: hypothetical protein M1813_004697 [Trichoglossum hirsutum]|nr:MAG: hypothetical protein M1813_004697 [Trichoglossum hirsutum]
MPPDRAQSKRKVVPSRRAYENARSHSIARPPLHRTSKRQSRVLEHIDLTSNDLPNPESKQQVTRKPSKPQEPLPTKYTLSIDVFVDNVCLYSRMVLQTAGAFDYTGLIGAEAQKTSEYCARIERDVSIRTSIAKIVYNKKECSQSNIDCLEDWRSFDELARTYLQDRSKKDVHLSWAITYQLKELSVEPEKEASELHDDESEDDTKDDDEEAETTYLPKKNTTTNQCLAEARAAPHSTVTNELLQIYKCRAPGCRNSAAYCYLAGEANGGHYALSSTSIRQWAEAVEDETATVHSLPASLVGSMLNVQKAQKAQKEVSSPLAFNLLPSPLYSLPPALPYYSPYPLPPPAPYGHAGPHGLPPESSNQAKASKKQVSRPSSSEGTLDLQSSPTDLCVVTSQYIAWYREKFPGQGRFLDNVVEQLEAGAYDLQGITELRTEDWRCMEIPDRLGKQLARNIAKFKRQRDST